LFENLKQTIEICWNVGVFQLISTYLSPKIRWNLIKYVENECWNQNEFFKSSDNSHPPFVFCWNHLKTGYMISTCFSPVSTIYRYISTKGEDGCLWRLASTSDGCCHWKDTINLCECLEAVRRKKIWTHTIHIHPC
jgi:hypothetical protein